MDDDILNYYERELTFIRGMGSEFAKKYPKIAGRLLLEPDKCEDPHIERLIEAFAFIGGRIHKKIDDDFPELTEALLSILYPHYLNPIPPMTTVAFEPLPQAVPPSGYHIDKNTTLYSKPVGGSPCHFTTVYPVTLWPIEVIGADLQDPKRLIKNAQQSLVIRLKTLNGMSVSALSVDRLRMFLNGPKEHVFHLYELLFNNVCHIECEVLTREGKTQIVPLPQDAICAVGFEHDEGMIPYPGRSFPGHILLMDYFCFPEKFLFFDLKGIDRFGHQDLDDTLTIWIYLDRVAKANLLINEKTFCLNATPAVNLFKRIAEPIRVEHRTTEYQVVPDVRRLDATEVFSVDRIMASGEDTSAREREFKPFYSVRHQLDEGDDGKGGNFWHLTRTSSGRKGDSGTEVFVSFFDWNFEPIIPQVETLTVHVTCTNRDLPARLPFGDPSGDFDLEVSAPVARIRCLVKPTVSRRVSMGGALQWRLISHLSLNYLSVVQGGEEALKEMLKLYDVDNSPGTRQQINGIVSLTSRHITKRLGNSMCRGVQTTITFDEQKYVGAGLYLFACILERFLGEYVSVNSFSQLIANTLQKNEILKKWPPRNGARILL